MKQLKLSFIYAKDIYAIILIDSNGVVVDKKVARIPKEGMNFTSDKNIYVCKSALSIAKVFVDANSDYDRMIIETNNSALIKHINEGWYEGHSDEFLDLLKVLDAIPVAYTFVHNKACVAKIYAKEKYLSKEKMVSIDDIFDTVDDE